MNSVAAEVVIDFLRNTLPFNSLDRKTIFQFARDCTIDFFPRNTLIFRQDETEVSHFYVIQKGGVRSYLIDNNGERSLKDFRGKGEYFGALPIIQKTRANLNVQTVDDTFCFLFEKQAFLNLIHSSPVASEYFLRTMSEKMAGMVYSELRQQKMTPRTEGALYLFSAKVGDMARGHLFTVPMVTKVQEAAVVMSDNSIGSLLLTDEDGNICGIVTDKDIRKKVVARGLDFNTALADIMVTPVRTISSQAVCFEALLEMIKNKIHHLGIEQQGEIKKMITTHDIMVAQGSSPLYLFREILAQRRISGLCELSQKIPQVVRSLIEEGAKANNITKMIAVLNDHILDRLLTLMLEETGAAPLPFAWMLLGSEGRGEQTFKTDQDNAIIYADPVDEKEGVEAEEFFRNFAETAIKHLVHCGYPLCPGEVMASNHRWRQPFPVWQGYFRKWCATPTPESVLNSTIFFDFKCGYGDTQMVDDLRSSVSETASRQSIFLLHMAKNSLVSRPPLTFFKNFIVEKDGEHKNTFDLKSKALVFFVDFARLMSLKHGIKETNTLARLRRLQEDDFLPKSLAVELIQAYEFLMHLRLVHQLQVMEGGGEPDNYINPRDFSDLERQTLKEAFGVISRIQEFVRQEFHLAEV